MQIYNERKQETIVKILLENQYTSKKITLSLHSLLSLHGLHSLQSAVCMVCVSTCIWPIIRTEEHDYPGESSPEDCL